MIFQAQSNYLSQIPLTTHVNNLYNPNPLRPLSLLLSHLITYQVKIGK